MREQTTRLPTHKFALGVAIFGAGAVYFTYSAISGNEDWQRNAFLAMGLWLLFALYVIGHYWLYKLSASSRLMVAGAFGIGMGVVLMAGAVLLQPQQVPSASLVVFAGALMILRGWWIRGRDGDAVLSEEDGRIEGDDVRPDE